MNELPLDDWRDISSAPRDATWIEIRASGGMIWAAHWAQDLSGEEQPVFIGWFVFDGPRGFRDIGQPKAWRPLNPEKAFRASGEMICERCHCRYYDHPPYTGEWEDVPYGIGKHYYLNLICDGSIVKL
jgi:hypothetical protein